VRHSIRRNTPQGVWVVFFKAEHEPGRLWAIYRTFELATMESARDAAERWGEEGWHAEEGEEGEVGDFKQAMTEGRWKDALGIFNTSSFDRFHVREWALHDQPRSPGP